MVVNRLYKNVATFKGGLPEWKKAGYPLNTQRSLPKYTIPSIDGKQFKTMVGQACIVDIRVPKLYGEGHLKEKIGIEKADALSPDYLKKYFLKIPLDKLSDQFPKIPKDRTVVVLDYRGKQALVAARFLKHHGYGEVCLVKGGLSAVSK